MLRSHISSHLSRILAASPRSIAAALAALTLGLAAPALAQQDPAGCFQSGPSIILGVFLADGVTGVGARTLTECETIVYRVTLTKAGASDVCAFQGGGLTLTTPDGVVHNLTPPGGIPCLGGNGDNGSGCIAGQAPVSGTVTYTLQPSDIIAGAVTANASYSGGVLFDGVPPTPGVSAATPKSTPAAKCSDGLVCDGLETCSASTIYESGKRKGQCLAGTPLVCTPDECDSAATCTEPSGCVYTPKPNGTACTDGDGTLCTQAACVAGTCSQTFTTVTCTPDSNECTNDLACDPGTGTCPHPPKANGTACTDSDGNACTAAQCNGAGSCVQSNNKPSGTSCPDTDGNSCTAAQCNGGGSCNQANPTPSGTSCTDTDGNVCTAAQCNGAGGCVQSNNRPDGFSCPNTDGNACTTPGCQAGACVQAFSALVCSPDSNECTDDPACNPASGCTHPAKADGTSCTDSDANQCTTAACQTGACKQNFTSTTCIPDANECTNDPACNPSNGLCEHPAKPNGTACTDSDANVCTIPQCQAGSCAQAASAVTCSPDANECTDDPACDAIQGCTHPNKTDGASCTETDNEICSVAGCVAGACDQTYSVNTAVPECLCPNGVVDPGETCDDGNTDDGIDDNCRNDCTRPVCGDPAKIRFRAGKTDFHKVVGRIEPAEPFDPLGKPLTFTLSKGGVTVGQWTLPPTALKGLGKPPIKRYVVLQKGVGSLPGGGVQKLFIGRHNGAWRFTFVGFADLGAVDLAVPTQVMDTVLAIGTDEYSSGGTWKPVRSGWILQEQNAYPMCTIGLTPP